MVIGLNWNLPMCYRIPMVLWINPLRLGEAFVIFSKKCPFGTKNLKTGKFYKFWEYWFFSGLAASFSALWTVKNLLFYFKENKQQPWVQKMGYENCTNCHYLSFWLHAYVYLVLFCFCCRILVCSLKLRKWYCPRKEESQVSSEEDESDDDYHK